MALTNLDSMTIDHAGSGTRTIMLCQGDIADMSTADAVDYIAVSALPGDYSPSQGSIIGALNNKGVSVQAQSANKAANYEPTMPCWVSQDVSSAGLNFSRFILFEPSNPATTAGWDVDTIFRALQCFSSSGNASIAVPMVSTGSAGADFSVILRQLFFMGSLAQGLTNWPFSTLKLVVYSSSQASQAKIAFTAMKAQYASPPGAQGGATAPSGVTQRQTNCIRAYTGNLYRTLNNGLRAHSLTNSTYIQYLATITGISSGLRNLPPYVGLALRGTTLPPNVRAKYTVGALITHLSYTSSSFTSPWPGADLIKINSLTGPKVNQISMFPSENEVLFDDAMTDTVTVVQGAGTEYGRSFQHRFTSNQTIPNYCGS